MYWIWFHGVCWNQRTFWQITSPSHTTSHIYTTTHILTQLRITISLACMFLHNNRKLETENSHKQRNNIQTPVGIWTKTFCLATLPSFNAPQSTTVSLITIECWIRWLIMYTRGTTLVEHLHDIRLSFSLRGSPGFLLISPKSHNIQGKFKSTDLYQKLKILDWFLFYNLGLQ